MRVNKWWPIASVAAAMLGSLAWRADMMRDLMAWRGFSPAGWVYALQQPQNFIHDYAGVYEAYRVSLVMYLYPLATSILSIDPGDVVPWFVAGEYLVMLLALTWVTRAIRPESSPAVGAIVSLLVTMSWARDVDLGRFGAPHFEGLYYNAADAARLAAIAATLQSRFVIASIALAISVASHVVMGVLGGLFIVVLLLVRRPPIRELIVPALIAGSSTLVIGILSVQTMGGGGELMDTRDWYRWSRLMTVHWYPIDFGLFGPQHTAHVLPLLSLLAFAFVAAQRGGARDADRAVVMATATLLAVSIAGVVLSAAWPIPSLIKLSLHRATLLVATIALIYAVDGVWRDVIGQALPAPAPPSLTPRPAARIARALCGSAVLLSPFFWRPAFPVLWTLVYVLLPSRDRRVPSRIALTIAAGLAAVTLAYYIRYDPSWQTAAYTGGEIVQRVVSSGVVGLAMAGGLTALVFVPRLRTLAVVVAFCLAALIWIRDQRPRLDELALAHDYRLVQDWVRQHTPPSALFMTDPAIYYGWRDFSARSSFGSLREWLYTGWAYTSSRRTFEEGLRRAREWVPDIDRYADLPVDYGETFLRLSELVQDQYYDADDASRVRLAQRYGVQYFVFQKARMTEPTALRVVHENDRFVVAEARAARPTPAWSTVVAIDNEPVTSTPHDWSTYSEGRPITWRFGLTPESYRGERAVSMEQPDAKDYWLYTGPGHFERPPASEGDTRFRIETTSPTFFRLRFYFRGHGTVDLYAVWFDADGKAHWLPLDRHGLTSHYRRVTRVIELPSDAKDLRVVFYSRATFEPRTVVFVDDLIIQRAEQAIP